MVFLLHGFPSSSRMFRNLIPQLADEYHIIAPDYPAFGHSGVPDRAGFAYTFDHFAEVIDKLLDQLEVGQFAIYVMDFGGPVRVAGGQRSAGTGQTARPSIARPRALTWTSKVLGSSATTRPRSTTH